MISFPPVMESLLQSKVSFPQFLKFVLISHLNLLTFISCLWMLFCFHLCPLWDSSSVVSHVDPDAVNQLFTFSSQPSSESGLYFRSPFSPNSSIYISRIQIIPIYPASGDPNHCIILKHYQWNSCGSHSLSSFVRPTYKISSFTFRCLIHTGLNGNILFGMFFLNGKTRP